MKKLFFGIVTDVKERANCPGSYIVELEDCHTGIKKVAITKLDDIQYDYLFDIGTVPYIYEKHNGKFYIRLLFVHQKLTLLEGDV